MSASTVSRRFIRVTGKKLKALLEIEPKLRRVRGFRHLEMLREAVQKDFGITKRQAAA